MCSHPRPHKVKDYGFAEEILCPQCWESLEVKSRVDYVRDRWFKRFLNGIRSWIASGELTTSVEMLNGSVVALINTFLVRSFARELGMDEDTLWKYALLLKDHNIDGIVRPTTIPHNGEHLAIQIIPAPRECEVWPYPVSDLAIDDIELDLVVGRDRSFKMKVWLDYYFDEPTQGSIVVGDETEECLGERNVTLVGKSTNRPYIVKVRLPSELGDHSLVVYCFYFEEGELVQADSAEFDVTVEEIPQVE